MWSVLSRPSASTSARWGSDRAKGCGRTGNEPGLVRFEHENIPHVRAHDPEKHRLRYEVPHNVQVVLDLCAVEQEAGVRVRAEADAQADAEAEAEAHLNSQLMTLNWLSSEG